MKTMKLLKRSWFGPWLVGLLCVLVLVATTPREAAAGLVEYAVILFLTAVVAIVFLELEGVNQGSPVVLGQLETAVNGAALANSEGDPHTEITKLSKAMGAAEALMGMTASCDDCADLRSDLQQIIGLLALLKSQALGVVTTCEPNGVIQGNEQCDPLAVPTGCPTSTTEFIFCNDECQCQGIP